MARHDDPPLSYYEPPEQTPPPRCPICRAETDTFKKNYWGEIVGCDECIEDVDAWDYTEDNR